MKRKHNSEEGLTPEELQRRKMQKELQALASKLRAGGESYKPQKHKRKVFKAEQVAAGLKPRGRRNKAAKDKKSKHDTPTWRPYEKTDVVILPIFWNMRHEEKNQIMTAAATAAELLQEAGLTSHTDSSNKYTPGQKMKYWETAGVKVRVEIGPKEAASGTALVARAGLPGTVAQKTSVNVAVQLVREVKQALQEGKATASTNEEEEGELHTAAGHGPEDGGAGNEGEEEDEGEREGEEDAQEDGDGQEGLGEGDEEEDVGGGSGDGESEDEDEAGGQQAGAGRKSNREKKREKKERKKAAQKQQARAEAGGANVQEGSRRDRKRKAKEAAEAAKTAAEGAKAVATATADVAKTGAAGMQAAGMKAATLQSNSGVDVKDEQDEGGNVQPGSKMSAKVARKAAAKAVLAETTARLEKQSAKREFKHLQKDMESESLAHHAVDSEGEGAVEGLQEGRVSKAQPEVQHHVPQKQSKTTGKAVELEEAVKKEVAVKKEQVQEVDVGPATTLQAEEVTAPVVSFPQQKAGVTAAPINAGAGADDLSDDFEIDPEFLPEPEEDALVLSKTQRMKKHKQLDKQRRKKERYGDGARAWDAKQDEGDRKAPQHQKTTPAKKKQKVIVF